METRGWPDLSSEVQERVMRSAASWNNAGRLRVAEPTLARLPLVQTPDQRRVLAQVAKLLAYVQGCGRAHVGLRAAGDAALTRICKDNRTRGFAVTGDRVVRLPSVPDVLRFLVTRPIVELRLLARGWSGVGREGTFNIGFKGAGLDTVVWDTYHPPEWAAAGWQQRLWKLLTYIQTPSERHLFLRLVLDVRGVAHVDVARSDQDQANT